MFRKFGAKGRRVQIPESRVSELGASGLNFRVQGFRVGGSAPRFFSMGRSHFPHGASRKDLTDKGP